MKNEILNLQSDLVQTLSFYFDRSLHDVYILIFYLSVSNIKFSSVQME